MWIASTLSHTHSEKDSVGIQILNSDAIQQLNNTYRQKNKPTNVLSFPNETIPGEEDDNYLGDLAFCADIIEQEARDQEKNRKIIGHI